MTEADGVQVWLLHGMKRSGNHAIANWLIPQLGCVYFNNVIPLGAVLRGKPIPAPQPFKQWHKARQREHARPLPRLLVTLEDHDLGLTPFSDRVPGLCRLLVLRSARQMLSSRIRKAFRVDMPAYPRSDGAVLQRAIGLWKQHVRCYLEGDDAYPGRIAILFDAWFNDREYRASISAALDVAFDDTGYGRVSGEGGGSSFDGVDFDGRAHLMSVADRDLHLDAHERALLDAVFRDRELVELERAVVAADPYRQLVLGQVRPAGGP
jgi:hypothetical protein